MSIVITAGTKVWPVYENPLGDWYAGRMVRTNIGSSYTSHQSLTNDGSFRTFIFRRSSTFEPHICRFDVPRMVNGKKCIGCIVNYYETDLPF
jgi:hypothetical protein